MNIVVNLYNVLVIVAPELRTKYSKNTAIKISNTLKSKGWIGLLTL